MENVTSSNEQCSDLMQSSAKCSTRASSRAKRPAGRRNAQADIGMKDLNAETLVKLMIAMNFEETREHWK